MTQLNETHNPKRRSWLASANEASCDFPIQNLPFGRFRKPGDSGLRIGVAIGDQVLDLRATGLVDTDDMNALMAASPAERQALRAAISVGLAEGSDKQAAWQDLLHAQAAVEMAVPCRIGDYTDFYVGIHHATRVGTLFRPDNPLLPNYKWVPIGYHGRASSIGVSGQRFARPLGQLKGAADAPVLGASQRLDYELELGFFAAAGNALGERIPIGDAERHLFGVTLLNDWSARDIQAWEYQPLGPFLAKNFATTISPWIVTMQALAPYRLAWDRPAHEPQPLAYLDSANTRAEGALDIQLEVWLESAERRAAGAGATRLTHTSFKHQYWTVSQMVAHHTVGGCNLQAGDLLGSGTISGPTLDQAGAMIELTASGRNPLTLDAGNGKTEQRGFLHDGDAVILKGWCEKPGVARIGFGESRGTVLPAIGA